MKWITDPKLRGADCKSAPAAAKIIAYPKEQEFSAAKDKAIVAKTLSPVVNSQIGKGAGDIIKMSAQSTAKSVATNLLK